MPKAFSESESARIRKKLIESCQVCWEKHGYQKTNVRELCKMAGISTGAFYLFFPSKEVLFVETANDFTDALIQRIHEHVPSQPGKSDLVKTLKAVFGELDKNKWIFSLREDYEVIMRKLPEGYLDKEYKKDLFNTAGILELYGIKPKATLEEMNAIFSILFLSFYFSDTVGEYHQQAVDLIIESIAKNLFE